MPARNTQGGTVLAGTLVVSATTSHGATAYSGEATFVGAGGFVESATLFMRASAAWAGAGNIAENATLSMQASANLVGVGGFTVDATTSRQPISAAATFAGAGSLVVNALHFSAGVYDETGAATLSVSGNALTELEFGLKLDYDNLNTGDVLSFRVYLGGQPLTTYSLTPSITIAAHAIAATAAFAGTGSLSVDSTVLRGALEGAATLAGVGNFEIVPALQMLAQGMFVGAGFMSVDLTQLAQIWQGEAAFVGAGILAATANLRMIASATFAGVGAVNFAGASIRIIIGRPPGEISDIFQGAGSFSATAKLLAQARATFAGAGSMSITPQEWMAARASFAGAGLLVADLTKLANYWAGEAAFIGAGNLAASAKAVLAAQANFVGAGSYSATSQMRIVSNAAYAGAGSFAATISQQLMAAQAAYSGIGSLVVDAIQLGKIYATVAFLGAGNLVVNTRQWMQLAAAFNGEGTASITPRLRMVAAKTTYAGAGAININPSLIIKAGVRATFSGIGNQSALAFLLCNASAKFAGVGNMAITPRLVMDSGEIDFNGVGLMAVTARQRMMVTGTFGGEGNFDITPRLRMRAFANYYGEGSMYVDLTPPVMAWSGQSIFVGEGTLSALATLDLATAASMEAAGNLSVDAVRFINLSELFFAGTGSLIVDSRQALGAFASFGGQGYLTVATMMTSARDYWLICSGITMQPEIMGDAAMAAAITGSFDVTTLLDGKPAVREC